MYEAYFHILSNPALKKPVFVQGLPGFGNIGKIAAYFLVKFCNAKPFTELYSSSFPDYASVTSKGLCRLPHYEFYAGQVQKDDFIIMSGDTQPSFEDVLAHYDLCDNILDYIQKQDCSLIVAIGGIPITEEKAEIYVAATSPRLANEFKEKGATLYTKGRIVGPTGLMLGLAKERGLEGICLLGPTSGFKADRGVGFNVFKFLMKALGYEVKEGL